MGCRDRKSPGERKKGNIERVRGRWRARVGLRESNRERGRDRVRAGQRLTNSCLLHRSSDQSRGGRAGPGHV